MYRLVLALALCRVSSVEQLENNSLNRQRDNVLKMAKTLSATIPEDGWWSGSVSSKRGTNITRKDLQEMLERCRRDKRIKYVIVDEVDRFMRSMLEIGYFLVEFKKLGVRVVFASQPTLSTETATDTLLLMLEAFKAEGSNEERQRKSIAGQLKALQEGRWTFVPKPGYKRGYERGVPIVDERHGLPLKDIMLSIVGKQITPAQGLKEYNKVRGNIGKALIKMDKFRIILADPFYAGIVEVHKQVDYRNENGLHEPLITKEQHLELLKIMNGNPKNQSGPRKNGNPKYPCNNIITCDFCADNNIGRVVGFDHTNGRSSKIYEKYRCRACGRYFTREELHNQVEQCFKGRPLTNKGLNELIDALNYVWKQQEETAEQETIRIKHRIAKLGEAISNQVEAATDPENSPIKSEILKNIAKKQDELSGLEERLESLKTEADNDRERFLRFAFEFIEKMGSRFLEISQEDRLKCKDIVFPAGFHIDAKGKVYTPEISWLYRLATIEKDAEASQMSHMVRVMRL